MQIFPEYEHLRKNITYISNTSKIGYSFDERVIKCRMIPLEDGLHIVANVKMKPGDTVVDVAAFDQGYTDVVRECEDPADAKFLKSVQGLYQKVLAGPNDIGAVVIEGEVNHDRALEIGGGYTVEVIHPDVIGDILKNNGECYILLAETDPEEAAKFVGRVLIIPTDQYHVFKAKAENK